MKIADGWPELTADEAKRFWLPPADLCRLAAIGEFSDPKVKKLLNTLSDRGHVPCVKSGPAKTHPRHYSLVSAAMLRTIDEVIRTGRTYRFASPVAEAVATLLLEGIEASYSLADLDAYMGDKRIVFHGMSSTGTPAVSVHCGPELPTRVMGLEYSILEAGYLIWRVTDIYTEFWAKDLIARGVLQRPAKREIGVDGWPIEDGGEDG